MVCIFDYGSYEIYIDDCVCIATDENGEVVASAACESELVALIDSL